MKKTEKLIESEGQADRPVFYGRIRIGTNSVDFLRKVQQLPVSTKITLMHLTVDQLLNYLTDIRKSKTNFLIQLSEKTWYWRGTGEQILKQEVISMEAKNCVSIGDALKRCKSKRPLPLKQIQMLINLFTSETSEMYYLDENGEKVYSINDETYM